MKLSTLAALVNGDIANAIVSETPGGIEAQEARGQQDFVASDTLPIKCNSCTREQLEAIGIEFGEPVDDLFVAVRLPDGWKKIPSDHSMWSNLVDDQGRTRAHIFYKAAFYDRNAHISIVRRFTYSVVPTCGYDNPNYRAERWHCIVLDASQTIWTSDSIEPQPDFEDRDATSLWYSKQDTLKKLGKAWLDEKYPDWQNPLAYW